MKINASHFLRSTKKHAKNFKAELQLSSFTAEPNKNMDVQSKKLVKKITEKSQLKKKKGLPSAERNGENGEKKSAENAGSSLRAKYDFPCAQKQTK